jgi:hypothetical protein
VLAFLHALRDDGGLSNWNQIAFLFRSVKNNRVVALARFLEASGVPVYSPRSKMYFEREEKADNQIEDAVVQAKQEFAQQIAVASGMEYRMIKATDANDRRYRMLV